MSKNTEADVLAAALDRLQFEVGYFHEEKCATQPDMCAVTRARNLARDALVGYGYDKGDAPVDYKPTVQHLSQQEEAK